MGAPAHSFTMLRDLGRAVRKFAGPEALGSLRFCFSRFGPASFHPCAEVPAMGQRAHRGSGKAFTMLGG